jgi:hypothetical protein
MMRSRGVGIDFLLKEVAENAGALKVNDDKNNEEMVGVHEEVVGKHCGCHCVSGLGKGVSFVGKGVNCLL